MIYDITFGEHNKVSIVVSDKKIMEGIGYNPELNEAVRMIYQEFLEAKKIKPTVGIGYSEFGGFQNLSIYEA